MNKILISILFVAMLFGCTKQPQSFTLHGTTESADMNGVTIFFEIVGERAVETVVENQKFTFEGSVNEPTTAWLAFNFPGFSTQIKPFILENADINVSINEDKNFELRGSRLNDLIQSFIDDVSSVSEQYERNRLILEFSKKHINTLPGILAVTLYGRRLPLENRIVLLDLMNETTRNNINIRELIQQTEAEQRVSAGQPFIDFTLPTPNGEMLSLSDVVRNHDYVLLHFWASWCPPCIRAFPDMTRFYNEHTRSSFEIFSVSLDTEKSRWKEAIADHNLVWHHVSDLKGWDDNEVRELYGVSGVPTTFLIDRKGKIVGRNMSLSEIAELLAP
jgi:peroxiredoxin